MARPDIPLPEHGHPHLVSDLISERHRHLPMLRVLLPVCREIGGGRQELIRWSAFLPLEGETAGLAWNEVVERSHGRHPEIRECAPATGELDEGTVVALRDAVGPARLHALRWLGYGAGLHAPEPVRVFDDEYAADTISALALEADDASPHRPPRRIPEFAWDDTGDVAWGARLYGDSFVIAARPDIIESLHRDPRIDTIPVRRRAEVMPPSAGD